MRLDTLHPLCLTACLINLVVTQPLQHLAVSHHKLLLDRTEFVDFTGLFPTAAALLHIEAEEHLVSKESCTVELRYR